MSSVHRDWIDQCLENGRGLTKWEHNFLESVSEQLDAGGDLSDRQKEILERIYAEKTP